MFGIIWVDNGTNYKHPDKFCWHNMLNFKYSNMKITSLYFVSIELSDPYDTSYSEFREVLFFRFIPPVFKGKFHKKLLCKDILDSFCEQTYADYNFTDMEFEDSNKKPSILLTNCIKWWKENKEEFLKYKYIDIHDGYQKLQLIKI